MGDVGALVRGRWGDGAFGSLAVAHEEMIIALERANASFERDNLCVETVGRDRCPPVDRRDTVRENKDVISGTSFFGNHHHVNVSQRLTGSGS